VIKAGGSVYQQKFSMEDGIKYPYRVIPGKLKVSRSIGDYELKSDRFGFKTNVVIAEPHVESYDIEDCDFILMASLYQMLIFR
jgi:hypothetical protein